MVSAPGCPGSPATINVCWETIICAILFALQTAAMLGIHSTLLPTSTILCSIYVCAFFTGTSGSRKVFNTHVVISGSGDIRAAYRKIHLFDVVSPQACNTHLRQRLWVLIYSGWPGAFPNLMTHVAVARWTCCCGGVAVPLAQRVKLIAYIIHTSKYKV